MKTEVLIEWCRLHLCVKTEYVGTLCTGFGDDTRHEVFGIAFPPLHRQHATYTQHSTILTFAIFSNKKYIYT